MSESITTRQRRFILVATIIASGTVFLDGTLVNIALPAIRDDLGSSFVALQWVVMADLLALAATLLPGGSLGDIFGKQTIFRRGCILYAAATLTSVIAPNTALLIVARTVMGITAGVMVPNSLALLTEVYTGKERGKAIGTWAAWSGIFTALGPLVGGVLIDAVHWRFAFLIPIPALVTAAILVTVSGRSCPGGHARKKIDFAGSILAALTMALVTFGLTMLNRDEASRMIVWISLGLGILALAAFIVTETRIEEPMMPMSLFAIRDFSVANVVTLGMYGAMSGGFFLVNLYLQTILGYGATLAGIATMPVTAMMLLLASRFGELTGTSGARWLLGVGAVLVGAGWFILSFAPMDASYWVHVLPGVLVFGFGLSMAVPPITTVVMSSVPDAATGIASGMNNALTRVASLIAVAVAGVIVLSVYAPTLQSMADNRPALVEQYGAEPFSEPDDEAALELVRQASLDGYAAAMRILGGLAAFGGVIAMVGLTRKAGR